MISNAGSSSVAPTPLASAIETTCKGNAAACPCRSATTMTATAVTAAGGRAGIVRA